MGRERWNGRQSGRERGRVKIKRERDRKKIEIEREGLGQIKIVYAGEDKR